MEELPCPSSASSASSRGDAALNHKITSVQPYNNHLATLTISPKVQGIICVLSQEVQSIFVGQNLFWAQELTLIPAS